MISVVLVDDDRWARRAIRDMLAPEADIKVVGEASDGAEALDTAARLRPDVVVMDIRMPHLDGIEATRRLGELAPDSGVLVLALYGPDEDVYGALEAGARGFVLKDDPPEFLVSAVRVVADGGALLGRAAVSPISAYAKPRSLSTNMRAKLAALTPREREVLTYIGQALSNAEIGRVLYISEETVKSHVGELLGKLEVNRVQAAILAFKVGLVPPKPDQMVSPRRGG